MIDKTAGGTPGFVKQGGTYFVYANANDAAGTTGTHVVSAVTANVTNITTGMHRGRAHDGRWPVDGGRRDVRLSERLDHGDQPTTSQVRRRTPSPRPTRRGTRPGRFTGSVTVDNTVPTASDIQTANNGSIVGRAEAGDTITYTFSEAMDPNSILSGWTGSATSVTLHLNNVGGGDTVTVFDSANTSQLNLGSVDLSRAGYTTAAVFFSNSTMTMTGSTITIVLGTPNGATKTVANTGAMVWSPSIAATDLAGNACSASTATESGALDKEF